MAFDYDFYDPDFTWALHRVYLCTVIERNLAQIVADLPATFTIVRSIRQKGLTLISARYGRSSNAGTHGSGFGSHNRHNGLDGGSDGSQSGNNKLQRRSLTNVKTFPYRSVVESHAEADEVPLRDSPHALERGSSRNIRLHTSIDISMESADSIQEEEHRKNMIEPWAKVSTRH